MFGDARDSADIIAMEASEDVLTSLRRQDELFTDGYRFEAAIARAAMVEGLLLLYLLVAKQVDRVVFDAKTVARLTDERMTFGQVKDALNAATAFHNRQLATDVEHYVKRRNEVAHHLAVGMRAFDPEKFHSDGGSIAVRLWRYILEKTEPHRRKNP